MERVNTNLSCRMCVVITPATNSREQRLPTPSDTVLTFRFARKEYNNNNDVTCMSVTTDGVWIGNWIS
jgi:hypothetical protein